MFFPAEPLHPKGKIKDNKRVGLEIHDRHSGDLKVYEEDEMLSRTNLFKGVAALALFAGVLVLPVQADTSVHEIKACEPGTHLLNLSIGNVNILKVYNHTDVPACFKVPAFHVHELVPAHSHRKVILKTIQSMEPHVFYTINPYGAKVQTAQESSSWSSSTKSVSLEKIINYNAEYEVINDPEPLYYDNNTYYQEPPAVPQPKPAASKRMIRGYW